MESVLNYIRENRETFVQQLREFLAIPSVSTDPSRSSALEQAADFLLREMDRIGLEQTQIYPTSTHPIVYGEWTQASGNPTVLIYGHYDVQPEDPREEWRTPPFEPTVKEGKLYARGASDNKGQHFAHLKAVEAYLTTEKQLPLNVKFLIEGEEEIGSPNLESFIQSHRDLLQADVVLISDGPMFAEGIPSITYGLRGLVYFQIECEGAKEDLHSGLFGGSIANPAQALAAVLSKLRDEKGRVTIPHFYDDVQPLSPEERAAWSKLPFDEKEYRERLGVEALEGEADYTTLERLWGRPTFEINGLLSGFTGEGAKTVLPAKAMAKVSMRLVPDQDPQKISKGFHDHLQTLCPPTVRMTIVDMAQGKSWVTETDHHAIKAASNALEASFGKKAVFTREGGSIPVVTTVSEILEVPVVLLNIGLPNDNLHAPNEKLNLDQFYRGIEASAHFLEELTTA